MKPPTISASDIFSSTIADLFKTSQIQSVLRKLEETLTDMQGVLLIFVENLDISISQSFLHLVT